MRPGSRAGGRILTRAGPSRPEAPGLPYSDDADFRVAPL